MNTKHTQYSHMTNHILAKFKIIHSVKTKTYRIIK